MGPVTAFISFFKGYVNFGGRARRSEFAWISLLQILVYVGASVLLMQVEIPDPDIAEENLPMGIILILGFLVIFAMGTFIPWIALNVRRFHDMGHSGWLVALFTAISFIPVLGTIISLIYILWLTFVGGTSGGNQYGPDPRNSDLSVFD